MTIVRDPRRRFASVVASLAAVAFAIVACFPASSYGQRPEPTVRESFQALVDEWTIRGWITALDDEDESVRRQAARELREIGGRAVPTIFEPFDFFGSTGSRERDAGQLALMIIGDAAVPPLVERLRDADSWNRKCGAWGLSVLGDAARPALPALIATFDREELDYLGDALVAVGAAAVPPLLERTSAKNPPSLRIRALRLLSLMATRSPVPPIELFDPAALLESPDGLDAAEIFLRLGLHTELAAARVARALERNEQNARWLVAQGFSGAGPQAAPVRPSLLRLLDDPELYLRCKAADGLASIGDPADRDRVVAVLVAALRETASGDRTYLFEDAATPVGRLGAAGGAAVPVLQSAIEDAKKGAYPLSRIFDVAIPGTVALWRIGVPSAGSALVELLRNPETCGRTVMAMANEPRGSAFAVSALVPLLSRRDGSRCGYHFASWAIREAAARVLGATGRDAREAIPALESALEDDVPRVRAATAGALRAIRGS
ncbi:MAG: HEAT repeat domain-containing protein [Planctomycetes bacterium]|nr:HEAT repeat domain-containing protein [Planctomycetota bacterium]MBI3846240.1 HEAT repeat domain-containing protein [Planctomycetota bacterium]